MYVKDERGPRRARQGIRAQDEGRLERLRGGLRGGRQAGKELGGTGMRYGMMQGTRTKCPGRGSRKIKDETAGQVK